MVYFRNYIFFVSFFTCFITHTSTLDINSTEKLVNKNGIVDDCIVGTPIKQIDIDAGFVIDTPGKYTLCENVTFDSSDAITIDVSCVTLELNGNTIEGVGFNSDKAIRVEPGHNNIVIQNGYIKHINDCGILFDGTTKSFIKNVHINTSKLDGITLKNNCEDCVIEGCSSSKSDRYGFGLLASTKNCVVKQCVATDSKEDGFHIQTGCGICLKDCKALSVRNNGFYVRSNSTSITCTNCIAMKPKDEGFKIEGSSDCILEGCEAQESRFGDGFELVNSNDIVVRNCTSLSNFSTGFFTNGNNNQIRDCSSVNNGNKGIENSGTLVVCNNMVHGNGIKDLEGIEDSDLCSLISAHDQAVCSKLERLDKCLVRIPITQADIPLVINSPGKYLLCEDVMLNVGNVITIKSECVNFDLNGHTITAGPANTAIFNNNSNNVTIQNGFIKNGSVGIFVNAVSLLKKILVKDICISNAGSSGIFVFKAECTIENCVVDNTNGNGIALSSGDNSIIKHCVVRDSVLDNYTIAGNNHCVVDCKSFNAGRDGQAGSGYRTNGDNCQIIRCAAHSSSGDNYFIRGGENCLTDCKSFNAGRDNNAAADGYDVVGACCRITRCSTVGDRGTGFFLFDTANALVEDCIAQCCGVNGFSMTGGSVLPCSHSVVRGCTAVGNGLHGFNNGSFNCENQIRDCSSIGNTGFGIFNDAAGVVVCNNIVHDNIVGDFGGAMPVPDSNLCNANEALCSKLEDLEDDFECSALEEVVLSVSDVLCSKIEDLEIISGSTGDVVCSEVDKVVLSVSDVLCSKLEDLEVGGSTNDSLCSEIEEAVLSVSDMLCSKIEDVDDTILSVSDTLCSKIDLISAFDDLLDIAEDVKSVLDCALDNGEDLCSVSETVLEKLVIVSSLSDDIAENISELDSVVNMAKDEIIASVCDKTEDLDMNLTSIGDVLCSKIETLSVVDEIQDALSCGFPIFIFQADIPLIIVDSGNYALCEDVTVGAGQTAITIMADDVTLDLSGRSIDGGLTSSRAINVENSEDISIKNGTLRNHGTNDICIHDCENVTVENIHIVSSPSASNILVTSATVNKRIVIQNCFVDSTTVNQDGCIRVEDSSVVDIENCEIINEDALRRFALEGVSCCRVVDTLVKGNQVLRNDDNTGFDVDVTSSDVTFNACRSLGSDTGFFIDANDSKICDCTAKKCPRVGFELNGSLTTVSGCTAFFGGSGFIVQALERVFLSDCKGISCSGVGIGLNFVNNCTLSECSVEDCDGIGLNVVGSNNIEVEGGRFIRCTSDGIRFSDINNSSFVDVTCNSNGVNGFAGFSGSDDVNIFFSQANFNSLNGILLQETDAVAIIDSSCGSNSLNGIFLQESDNTTIQGTSCIQNVAHGIELSVASLTTIGSSNCSNNGVNGIFVGPLAFGMPTSEKVSIASCIVNNNGFIGVWTANNIMWSGAPAFYIASNSRNTRVSDCTALGNPGGGFQMSGFSDVNGPVFTCMFSPVGIVNTVKGIAAINTLPLASIVGLVPVFSTGKANGSVHIPDPLDLGLNETFFGSTDGGNYTDATFGFGVQSLLIN